MDCDSERIWQIVERHRLNVPKRKRPAGNNVSLFDRLHNCYVEYNQNSSDKTSDKRFRSAVNLLQRVNPAHAQVSLIVGLHSDEKGYSLSLCPNKDGEVEEIFLPYEDNEIFSYLDNQEIPPVLLEVLEKTQHCHLYNGCVVCEIRDYRNPPIPGGYAKHLQLLHPTAETLLATVNEIAQEANCTAEEKLLVESHLLVATQPPLCLETTTDVVCVTNRLQYNQRKYHTHSMRRYLRRRSQACRSRMHMMSEGTAPEKLRLHDFILHKKASSQLGRDLSDVWKKPKLDLPLPSSPEQLAREVLQHVRIIPPVPIATAEQPQELLASPILPLQPKRGEPVAATMPRHAEIFDINQLLEKGSSSPVEPTHAKPVKHEPSTPTTTIPHPALTWPTIQPAPTPPGPPSIPILHPGMLGIPPGPNAAMLFDFIRNQAQAQAHAQAQAADTPSISRTSIRIPRPIAPAIPSKPHLPVPTLFKTLGGRQMPVPPGVGPWTPTGSTVNVVVSPISSTQTRMMARTGAKGIVVVSRPAGSQGQQIPGFVSVQQVSSLMRQPPGISRAATPPLKKPHPAMGSAVPSPPTLHTPPKLQRPSGPLTNPTKPGDVQASMPKLTPLDPLKQPSPAPAPLPISGKSSTTPAMPQLHKIAVAAPRSHEATGSPTQTATAAAVATSAKQAPPLKASPLVLAKRLVEAQPQAQLQQQPHPQQQQQLRQPKSKKTPKGQKGQKGHK